jgi:uncharacterized membrane protein
MGFWIFMLLVNMMIPLIMIGVGTSWKKNPPRTINKVYGYRTRRSSQNQETWNFAQQEIGKIWKNTGLALIPISVIWMLPLLGKNEDTVGFWASFLCLAQVAVMFVSIFFVEKALKKQFDKDGKRRDPA